MFLTFYHMLAKHVIFSFRKNQHICLTAYSKDHAVVAASASAENRHWIVLGFVFRKWMALEAELVASRLSANSIREGEIIDLCSCR